MTTPSARPDSGSSCREPPRRSRDSGHRYADLELQDGAAHLARDWAGHRRRVLRDGGVPGAVRGRDVAEAWGGSTKLRYTPDAMMEHTTSQARGHNTTNCWHPRSSRLATWAAMSLSQARSCVDGFPEWRASSSIPRPDLGLAVAKVEVPLARQVVGAALPGTVVGALATAD